VWFIEIQCQIRETLYSRTCTVSAIFAWFKKPTIRQTIFDLFSNIPTLYSFPEDIQEILYMHTYFTQCTLHLQNTLSLVNCYALQVRATHEQAAFMLLQAVTFFRQSDIEMGLMHIYWSSTSFMSFNQINFISSHNIYLYHRYFVFALQTAYKPQESLTLHLWHEWERGRCIGYW
jgi:hypothetical protein